MDNSQAPLVEEANAAAAECGDDCRTSEFVASESDEPRDHLRRTVLQQGIWKNQIRRC